MVDSKISIIGAGSGAFARILTRDICLTPNLEGATISLMDINKERLDAVYSLCKRYADEVGIRLKFEKTVDRGESLKDADFVINSALAGGHRRLGEGWSIALKHGYSFGGSFHIMHDEAFWVNFYQYKLFDSVISDVLDICPDAWYIQDANPILASITYETRKYNKAKIVGLCSGSDPTRIASQLRLEREHVTAQAVGVNHFVWLTHFYYKGEDAYPILDKWIRKREADLKEKEYKPSWQLIIFDLYKKYHLYWTCCQGDGCWPWWYYVKPATEKRWRFSAAARANGFISYASKQFDDVLKVVSDPSIKVTSVFPAKKTGYIAIPLVESLACDIPRVLHTNIQNVGDFVPGIPRDFEVEIPTLVSRRGIQGIQTDGLPKPLIAFILRERVAPVEIELEAYETGSKELLVQLIMMDPWTRSEEQARRFLDDILSLQCNEEMRQHYK